MKNSRNARLKRKLIRKDEKYEQFNNKTKNNFRNYNLYNASCYWYLWIYNIKSR